MPIVFSKTLEHVHWNATIARDVVPEEIMELKAQPGGDLALGGANLAAEFMRHDLIDEYRLYVHPVVIWQGTPLFPSDAKVTASSPTFDKRPQLFSPVFLLVCAR